MIRKWLPFVGQLAGIVLILALGLFGPPLTVRATSYFSTWDNCLSPFFRVMASLVGEPETQWAVMLGVILYFFGFISYTCWSTGHGFWKLTNPDVLFTGLLIIGSVAYALNYGDASRSTSALLLVAGLALRQVVSLWFRRPSASALANAAPMVMMILLAMASVWHPDFTQRYVYRGSPRWSGPWESPNTYGLLMGLGLLLTVSLLVSRSQNYLVNRSRGGARGAWAFFLFLGLLAVLFTGCLLRSYSRGAWLATLCGLIFFWIQVGRTGWFRFLQRLQGFMVSCMMIVVAVGGLAFWHFRHTEWHLARRAFSVANTNDFSWRNRLAAWEGTLQMMAWKPWFGFGWEKSEPMYDHFFRPPKLSESMAIHMNDYLMLGVTLGLPALFIFLAGVWFSAKYPTSETEAAPSPPRTAGYLRAGCLGGALALLIGFWFDGGIFNLPTATIFWVLGGWVAADPKTT